MTDLDLDQRSRQLLLMYQEHTRPFFVQQQLGGIEALDRHAELLQQALNRPQQVRVGFVGEAQVGKSSLINAAVGRRVLPAGGIGPLTARATSVDYADEDRMNVRYHDRRALNRLVFGMTRYLESIGEIPRTTAPSCPSPVAGDAPEEELDEIIDETRVTGESGNQETREKGEYMLLQAARMLGLDDGTQRPSGRLLVDAMRSVINTSIVPPDPLPSTVTERITELKGLVGTSETLDASTLGGRSQFNAALRDRAAGWRSPLIADLHLGLSAPVLQGLSIVDLPGIGTVADPAARVAKDFVEHEGHALVVVFRNSGLTEAVAELLERTGVITRMLFGGNDGHPPIQLLLVVTHLDDVAKTRWAETSEDDGDAVDQNVLFQDLSREMQEKLLGQVRAALLKSEAFADLSGEQLRFREDAVNQLCDAMRVLCVSSPEFLSLSGATKLSPWLTDPNATGIPGFCLALQQMAKEASARRARDVDQYEKELHSALLQHLSIVRQQFSEKKGAAAEEFSRFEAELGQHLGALRTEMQARHGETFGVLRRGLLARIDTVCLEAQLQGGKRLERLRKKGEELHYQSLLAALTRNGVWDKRNINYPDDLTRAVVDAIAAQWEPAIISAVRKEIRDLADFDLALVDRLIQAATELNPRIVAESQIETQTKILQQNSRAAVAWTKEQLEDLREKVQQKLRGAVEPPIMQACKQARNAGRHQGAGGKGRILDTFQEGGAAALVQAGTSAQTVLREQYGLVLRRLDKEYLDQHHDPVTAAFENLTNETGRRALSKDQHERQALIERIDELIGLLAQEGSEDARSAA